jgi:hypothetical protein
MKGFAALPGIFFLFFLAGFLSAQAPEAYIQELSGTVEVKFRGASGWVPAERGMRLERESLISTGLQSSAAIMIGQSKVMLRPLTRLSIEELAALPETEQVGLFLRTGKIRAEVAPPAGGKTDFTVRGPQVTNSVRGTVFEFDTVRLRVEEGRVWFTPNAGGSAALVRAGESSAYMDAVVLVSPPHALVETLRPELPQGTENGAAMPEPVLSPPAGNGTGTDTSTDTGSGTGTDTGTDTGQDTGIDTGITINW